jgi:hypothetical protein
MSPRMYASMKRIDQGHPNPDPKTDLSRPGIEPGPSRWEASALEKSHSNSYSERVQYGTVLQFFLCHPGDLVNEERAHAMMGYTYLNRYIGDPLPKASWLKKVGNLEYCI